MTDVGAPSCSRSYRDKQERSTPRSFANSAWLRWPVLDVIVQGQPLPGFSARHVLQDLLATRSVPKDSQKPGIRSVDTFVESATDEAGAQLLR